MRNPLPWLCGFLIAALVWFAAEIVRMENQLYAQTLGFCQEYSWREQPIEREQCLDDVIETRRNPLLHLLHGLRILR
jgi:hypothetical protein